MFGGQPVTDVSCGCPHTAEAFDSLVDPAAGGIAARPLSEGCLSALLDLGTHHPQYLHITHLIKSQAHSICSKGVWTFLQPATPLAGRKNILYHLIHHPPHDVRRQGARVHDTKPCPTGHGSRPAPLRFAASDTEHFPQDTL